MTFEEKEIHDFLKGYGKQFVSAKEICRRAGGKKKFAKNPHWAMPLLNGMVERKILESDSMAHYRILPEQEEKKKQWMSPEIARILKEREEQKREEAPPLEIDTPEPQEPAEQ